MGKKGDMEVVDAVQKWGSPFHAGMMELVKEGAATGNKHHH